MTGQRTVRAGVAGHKSGARAAKAFWHLIELSRGFKHDPMCVLKKSLRSQCGKLIGWGKTGSRKIRYAMAVSKKYSETLGEILLDIPFFMEQINKISL